MATAVASSSLFVGPLGVRELLVAPFPSPTSAIEARLVSPAPSDLRLTRVPTRLQSDQPLQIEFLLFGLGAGSSPASIDWLSDHILLSLTISGESQTSLSVRFSLRLLGSVWVARALIRPTLWDKAASVTLVSILLAGHQVPSEFLPRTLQVGYNHASDPEGMVFEAAKAGNVPGLQGALDAGGSTEEREQVRGGDSGDGVARLEAIDSPSPTFFA